MRLLENIEEIVGKTVKGAAKLTFTDGTGVAITGDRDGFAMIYNSLFKPQPEFNWRLDETRAHNAMLLRIGAYTEEEIEAVKEEYWKRYPEERPE